jgi:hypothetical protein
VCTNCRETEQGSRNPGQEQGFQSAEGAPADLQGLTDDAFRQLERGSSVLSGQAGGAIDHGDNDAAMLGKISARVV